MSKGKKNLVKRKTPPRPLPEPVLLIRLYFVNKQPDTKFISFGFFPNRNYEACVEFGSTKQTLVLPSLFFSTLCTHLPTLCEHIANGKDYKISELGFALQTTNKKQSAKLTYNKKSFYLNLPDLNYLMVVKTIIENHLSKVILSKTNVTNYIEGIQFNSIQFNSIQFNSIQSLFLQT